MPINNWQTLIPDVVNYEPPGPAIIPVGPPYFTIHEYVDDRGGVLTWISEECHDRPKGQ